MGGWWGGMITFMFLCTHRHSNLIIFLAVEHLHALLFHDQLPVGWGGVVGGVGSRLLVVQAATMLLILF